MELCERYFPIIQYLMFVLWLNRWRFEGCWVRGCRSYVTIIPCLFGFLLQCGMCCWLIERLVPKFNWKSFPTFSEPGKLFSLFKPSLLGTFILFVKKIKGALGKNTLWTKFPRNVGLKPLPLHGPCQHWLQSHSVILMQFVGKTLFLSLGLGDYYYSLGDIRNVGMFEDDCLSYVKEQETLMKRNV